MQSNDLSKLRQFYHSILGQQKIFEAVSSSVLHRTSIMVLEKELVQLNKEFPIIAPPFNINEYYSHNSDRGDAYYHITAIKTFIAMVLGRLQIAIEQSTGIPITEKRQFAFVKNSSLRVIIERDYTEIQKAYISECWKCVIILCGGTIEAILTDLLVQNQAAAETAKSAPKNSDITKWDLSNLIAVAVELSLISTSVEKLSHSIREYRNLVHPGNEFRNKLRFDAEEAKIAVEVLNIVQRDLSH